MQWNRRISTADGFRYIGGVVLALIVVNSVIQTAHWDRATLLRAALIYPPTILLIAALFAPRRLKIVLRLVTGVLCGTVLVCAVYALLRGGQPASARDSIRFANLAFWLPIHGAGLWWAITGNVAPWMQKSDEQSESA